MTGDPKSFFNAKMDILLLINLAQHWTPPAPCLGQRFETWILLYLFILNILVYLIASEANTMIAHVDYIVVLLFVCQINRSIILPIVSYVQEN